MSTDNRIKTLEKQLDKVTKTLDAHTLILAFMFDKGHINKLEYQQYLREMIDGPN